MIPNALCKTLSVEAVKLVRALGRRMVGHEDVDLFTLLPAPSSDGLQALNPRTGRWVNVQAPPGSIIVNSKRPQRLSSRCRPEMPAT